MLDTDTRSAAKIVWISTTACLSASLGYWALFHGRDSYVDFQGVIPALLWLVLAAMHAILGFFSLYLAWYKRARLQQLVTTIYFTLVFVVQSWVALDYSGYDERLIFAYQEQFAADDVALHQILSNNNIDHTALQKLLEEGANPDAWRGTYPIWRAYDKQDFTAISMLLNHGAQPDRNSRSGTRYDQFKYWVDGPMERLLLQRDKRDTLICKLVQDSRGHLGIAGTSLLEDLLQASSNPNQRCRFRTPVSLVGLAIISQDLNALVLLHQYGGDLHTTEDRDAAENLLALAAHKGDDSLLGIMMRLLPVSDYADAYAYALESAIEAGHADIAAVLLNANARLSRQDGVSLAILKAGGNITLLRALVDAGADPNYAQSRDKTPLDHALQGKNLPLLKDLILLGANVNCTQGKYGLLHNTFKLPDNLAPKFAATIIAAGGDIERRNSNGHSFLMSAANRNNLAMAELALKSGADRQAKNKRGQTAGALALHNKASDEMLALLQVTEARPQAGTKELVWAAQYKSADHVTELLDQGIDVNSPAKAGINALEAAARRGRLDICKLLLSQGANPNLIIKDGSLMESSNRARGAASVRRLRGLSKEDDPGISLLASALLIAKVDIANLLAKSGAKVDAVANSRGDTILHLIAQAGRKRDITSQTLINMGAESSPINDDGYTPLTLAAKHRAVDMIGTLVNAGVDINSVDAHGRTVIGETLRAGSVLEHLQLLLQLGAIPTAADLSYAREKVRGDIPDLLSKGVAAR